MKRTGTKLLELLEQLKKSTNPVTDLAILECIIDRLKRKVFY